MGGKAAILLVLGFSMIFLVAGSNFNRVASTSVDNVHEYYLHTNAFNIAVSAANIAAREIFFDPTWTEGFNNRAFAGGTMSASVEIVNTFHNIRRITATGVYQGSVNTIRILLRPGRFSLFAYYSANEPSGIWWTTGDEVTGPMHVQGILNVSGRPIFRGRVTTEEGLNLSGSWQTQRVWNGRRWVNQQVWVPDPNNDPQFLGGYSTGINLEMPDDGIPDLITLANEDGRVFNHDTVYIKFEADSIKYKFAKANNYTAEPAISFSSNGVICAQNSVLRIEGTVKGQFTVVSTGSNPKGKIFLDDDIVYFSNPQTFPKSEDILGIVAQNDIMVTNNTPNQSSINIHAAVYSQSGGFGAESYNTGTNRGHINLYGGISQHTRRAVGTIGTGSTIATGYSKNYVYDQRFRLASPPHFPATGSFQMTSWLE